MWARRCGAPPGWPSRVKVLIFSAFSGTIGLSVYNYMAASNLNYLDFTAPASDIAVCMAEWPSRASAVPVSHPTSWYISQEEWEREHPCPVSVSVPCEEVMLPLRLMSRPLGAAFGPGSRANRYDFYSVDSMVWWARCFLLITFFLWMGITVHDLALAGGGAKDYVLDVIGINDRFPLIRRMWRQMAGKTALALLYKDQNAPIGFRVLGFALLILGFPVLLLWNILVFQLLITPVVCGIFVCRPIRMSRAWVFIVSILSSLYGLALTIHFLFLIFSKEWRPRYAATWPVQIDENGNITIVLEGGDCICGCNYSISSSVCLNVTVIGLITLVKSIFISVRCLKGLRRTQWASLLSVLFPIPLTVYEVNWFKSSGQQIKYRADGEPVQGEYAFDPFAMMDEQEDSAYTTVNLRPELIQFEQDEDGMQRLSVGSVSRALAMPAMPTKSYSASDLRGKEYVGCCGFPWRTSGKSVVFDTPERAISVHEELFGKNPEVQEWRAKNTFRVAGTGDFEIVLADASSSAGAVGSGVTALHSGSAETAVAGREHRPGSDLDGVLPPIEARPEAAAEHAAVCYVTERDVPGPGDEGSPADALAALMKEADDSEDKFATEDDVNDPRFDGGGESAADTALSFAGTSVCPLWPSPCAPPSPSS